MLDTVSTALAFTNPAGAWSFLAVAAVAALYLFHRRCRPQRATGLFLWGAPRSDTTGGRTRESLIRSRAFWFDLAAAALLALALTEPQWTERTRARVLILDNAVGMQSNDNHKEARRIAVETAATSQQIAVVLAGATPRTAKALAQTTGQEFAVWLEENYTPAETRADIPRATAFAKELYGGGIDIHIITNQNEAERFAAPGATVHALAGQGDNLAFRHIWRRKSEANGNEETLFLGVENFGEATNAALSVATEEDETEISNHSLRLPPGTTLLEIPVADNTHNTLRITLTADNAPNDKTDNPDSMQADSQALVPPAAQGRPGVAVTDLPPETRRATEAAFRAAGCPVTNDAATAELLVTGNHEAEGRVATLRFIAENTPAIAQPPFRVGATNAANALCRDFDLTDALWIAAARDHAARPDETFMEVGTTPLYWREGDSTFLLNLLPARGNITRTPAWPVLLANLSARVEAMRPDARSPTEGLPLYGSASDTRTLSPRAETTRGAERADEETGRRDLRWPLFLAAAALLGYNQYSSAKRRNA